MSVIHQFIFHILMALHLVYFDSLIFLMFKVNL